MTKVLIDYDGAWPNLCSGNLIVTIDDVEWDFGNVLLSGGRVWFDDDWSEHVENGEWTINSWPDHFPRKFKQLVIDAVNEYIPHGCCGGCV
jgi:hypothetical protein